MSERIPPPTPLGQSLSCNFLPLLFNTTRTLSGPPQARGLATARSLHARHHTQLASSLGRVSLRLKNFERSKKKREIMCEKLEADSKPELLRLPLIIIWLKSTCTALTHKLLPVGHMLLHASAHTKQYTGPLAVHLLMTAR